MKTDYPKLEGVEVDYIYGDGPVCKSKVVGVNYFVGISIVSIEDPSRFTICLNAKLHNPKINPNTLIKDYRKYFYAIVKGIKMGYIKSDDLEKYYKRTGSFINTNCAFT